MDQLFERYVRPSALAGPGSLRLLYQRKVDPQDEARTYIRRFTPGNGWSAEHWSSGSYTAAGVLDDTLYILRTRTYSVYRGEEWRTLEWPPPWVPTAACRVGDQLWVFGLHVAAGQCKLRVASFVQNPKTLEKAGAEGFARPAAIGGPLALPAAASDLSAVGAGDFAVVFWHQSVQEGAANELWYAAFDGERWAEPLAVALPYPSSDYAVAEHAGAVWVFAKRRGRRMTQAHPLQAMALNLAEVPRPSRPSASGRKEGTAGGASRGRPGRGAWSAPQPMPGATDPWLDWTFDMDAASFDGALWLFRGCMNRMVLHRWRDGQWEAPQTLFQASPWRMVVLWWWAVNGGLGLLLLPLVGLAALRARGKPRPTIRIAGVEVRVATWARRVAALLVDVLMTEMIYTAAAVLLWPKEEPLIPEELVPGMAALRIAIVFIYFVVSEGLSGQTLGKRVLGIAVVGADGRRPSLRGALIRNLLRPPLLLAPVAYLVGSILLLRTPASQRLGDLLGRTLVVDLPPPAPRTSDSADE